ncbi:MAG: SH3 domain-containing protein [Clostridia bacterium]|nr:SH3 domain-containing protein [Clostridia bacterium]
MKRILTAFLAVVTLAACLFAAPAPASAKDLLKNTDPDRFYIVLDLNNQFVTVYEKDENGEYTRPVRRFICSTGRSEASEDAGYDDSTPTPVGVWRIGGRERFGKFAKFSEYARYWTQLVQDIYFHSIMFNRRDFSTMLSGPYGSLGNDVSHGCIRLLVEDAKWLYYYACPGTRVRVTKSEKYNKELTRALKAVRNNIKFKDYKKMSANYYDEAELPNDRCWVTDKEAALHKESKRTSKNMRRLSVGEELEVLIYNEAWVKVRCADGKEGYVYRGYLSMIEGESDTVPDATVQRVTQWMFDKPEAEQENRVCKVPSDTTVEVLERNEETGWAKIRYYTDEGWMQTKYLTTKVGMDLTKRFNEWA